MGLLGWLLGMGCENVTPDEVREMKDRSRDIVLVDVRTPEEYAEGRIEGAKHIPVRELERRSGEIPTDKDVVFYCHSGARSAFACRFMKKLGYTRVKNMSGGIARWRR